MLASPTRSTTARELFVFPMLLALAGPGIYAAATSPTPDLRQHFLRGAGFVTLVCLWAVYFGGAEQLAVSHSSATTDPIHSVHVGINVIYGVLSGLVMFAAGSEILLTHAHSPRAEVAGVLVPVGPMVYLLSQAIWFRVETGTGFTREDRCGFPLVVAQRRTR